MRHATILTKKLGFTLFETLISISIGITLFGLVLGIYTLSLRSLADNQNRSELTQESRSILERLTRDIREAKQITTALPQTNDDPQNPPVSEIKLEDGHTGILQYIRYYITETDLKRQILQYHFSSDPSVLVPFDSADDFGNPPDESIITDDLVSKFIESIGYYGQNPISVELVLLKGSIRYPSRISLYGRNF
ncbi:hypothetical protein BK004_02655 [bacterium CG10_46_32]|nr:MAG: hypothetical protein BK004_02655 [bacterium CG10_46_32]PIR56102.1 MAG: hypothetical protein COU73_02680 [Parcubacteria group bacterium CG10_big_fil_rev_8_21_14_0_10_46_32]